MRMRRRILPVAAFLALLPSLLSFCYADDEFVKVMGFAECVDCSKSGIKTSQAFSGLQVTVECRAADGHVETSQAAELSEDEGKFTVSLPQKLAMEAKLGAQTCSAKLLAADLSPCKPHHAAEDSKLLVSPDHLQLMTISGKLKLSTQTCVSKFFWTHPFHPITFPPCQPLFQPPPPPPPAVKPPPPPVPVYKAPPPPPVPVYKAPPPPPVPVYRPTLRTVMIYKPPPSPKFMKLSRPILINLHPNSPIHSPALAKLPPIPEEDPRRYFHHRKYGKTIS